MRQTKIFKELTASEITATALQILTAQGARVRRVNNVGAWRKRSNQVKRGWSDIQGYSRDGKALLCEVKKIGDSMRKEQTERLTDCVSCGGIGYIATQNKTTGQFELNDFIITTNQ